MVLVGKAIKRVCKSTFDGGVQERNSRLGITMNDFFFFPEETPVGLGLKVLIDPNRRF